MQIQIGDSLPHTSFKVKTSEGMSVQNTSDLFSNKTVAVVALPGAFTPTCSATHLPGYVVKYDELLAKGIDDVVCISVNDAHVMSAWKSASNADNIIMFADGDASFTKQIGMDIDIPGMGIRSRRYSMLIENMQVKAINLEEPGKFEVSDVDSLLSAL